MDATAQHTEIAVIITAKNSGPGTLSLYLATWKNKAEIALVDFSRGVLVATFEFLLVIYVDANVGTHLRFRYPPLIGDQSTDEGSGRHERQFTPPSFPGVLWLPPDVVHAIHSDGHGIFVHHAR